MVHMSSEESLSPIFDLPKKKVRSLVTSISIMVGLWAKRANKLSRKMKTKTKPSGLPITCPKQLLKTISNIAVTLVHKKKNGDVIGKLKRLEEEEEWGDGGVWQRAIMMGDKCQPLDFSGVICYDCDGKMKNQAPRRSPRARPSPWDAKSISNGDALGVALTTPSYVEGRVLTSPVGMP